MMRTRLTRRLMLSRHVVAGASLGALLAGAAGCDLNLENPNSPTEEQIIRDPQGIMAVAVGLQGVYAQTIDDYMVTNSLITDEWGTRSLALLAYISLMTGENFDPGYGVVSTPWARTYLVVKNANTVLAGATDPVIGQQLGRNMRIGVSSLARLYKAMALGFAIQQFEEVPIDISVAGPVPQPRAVVLDTILTLLEAARADLATVTDADLSEFRTRVLGAGVNLRTTVDAMLARYYLMAGQYPQAFDAADRVPLTVISEMRYPAPTRNPIQNLAFGLNYVAGLQEFIDDAEPGDRRPEYWLDVDEGPLGSNPAGIVLRPFSKYSDPNESFPLYLPGEMLLIKAEALTRLGGAANFLAAAGLVNQVRTQASSPIDEPVAGLPPHPPTALLTEAQLLDAIAYERRYELYMQGLRWEDTRRLGTARTTVPTFQWLPIPTQECLTNPSRPCA